MPGYVCETCEKTFQQKSHYETHKQRIRPCKKDEGLEKLIEKKVQEALMKTMPRDSHCAQSEQKPVASAKVDYMKPFLKWVGGKTQILDEVLTRFPTTLNNYYEPFVGGGSVLLGFLSCVQAGTIKVSGNIYASDLNSNLIGLYKNIQSQPDVLIREVKKLVAEFMGCKGDVVNRKASTYEEAITSPESYYFWIRSRFNALSKEDRMTPLGSAMLLFMNKTCFRGVYREGPNGFNVPFGNYKNPGILDEAHIRAVSSLLKNVVFTTASFTEPLSNLGPGDFAYLDPPYAPESDTSFVSYTSDGFSLDQHKALFTLCSGIRKKSASFLLSNADVKLVKDAFPASIYKTEIVSCRRAIHSKSPDAKTNEVLICPSPILAKLVTCMTYKQNAIHTFFVRKRV